MLFGGVKHVWDQGPNMHTALGMVSTQGLVWCEAHAGRESWKAASGIWGPDMGMALGTMHAWVVDACKPPGTRGLRCLQSHVGRQS